jgi:hypothetical protein
MSGGIISVISPALIFEVLVLTGAFKVSVLFTISVLSWATVFLLGEVGLRFGSVKAASCNALGRLRMSASLPSPTARMTVNGCFASITGFLSSPDILVLPLGLNCARCRRITSSLLSSSLL